MENNYQPININYGPGQPPDQNVANNNSGSFRFGNEQEIESARYPGTGFIEKGSDTSRKLASTPVNNLLKSIAEIESELSSFIKTNEEITLEKYDEPVTYSWILKQKITTFYNAEDDMDGCREENY